MVYVQDHARSWSPRRRAKAIERSVDRALAEVAAHKSAQSEAFQDLVCRAQTAVAGLPLTHFEGLGRKHGISANDAEGQLMRLALSRPALVLKAVENTAAKAAPIADRAERMAVANG